MVAVASRLYVDELPSGRVAEALHRRIASYLPWRDAEGRPRPWPPRWWLRFPAVLTYSLVTSSLLVVFAILFDRRIQNVPDPLLSLLVYQIPELSHEPLLVPLHLLTSVWINHHPLQLVYVLALLALFGVPFEIKEGSRRAILVFYGTSVAAGLGAGFALHGIRFLHDANWVDVAWEDRWVGGSAGAFGLMGAFAARARRPWPWLLLFLAWETGAFIVYLRDYTPAFHLSALALGFLWTRYRFLPRR